MVTIHSIGLVGVEMKNTDSQSSLPDLYKAIMDNSDIRISILCALYEAFFDNTIHIDFKALCSATHSDEKTFWKIVGELETEGLIKLQSDEGSYGITASGILAAEEDGIVSENWAEHNRHARIAILDELVRAYDEHRWVSDANVAALATNINLDMYSVISNLRILHDFDYVKSTAMGAYSPTEFGTQIIRSWRQ